MTMTKLKTEKPKKMMNKNFETREAWLKAAVGLITPIFEEHGYKVPEYRVSCGWPSRGATKSNTQTIGQAWSHTCSGDDTPEMFISPVLGAGEVSIVLETLAHEMVHIVVGQECGHRGAFKKCATLIGLEGKMTATHAGEALAGQLQDVANTLGTYPHAKITPGETLKKNKNRHHKFICADTEECEFICRASKGPVEEFGPPWHCGKMMIQEDVEEEEEPEPEPKEEWTPPKAKAPPLKDLSKREQKARKAANDKASRIRRREAWTAVEVERKASLSVIPFPAKLPFTFFNRLHTGKRGSVVEATEHTLLRYVDGKRFEYSEDGGAMWLEGTVE